jgi:hypothetical protein
MLVGAGVGVMRPVSRAVEGRTLRVLDDVLASRFVEEAMDRVLASALVESVGRELARHAVIERLSRQVITDEALDRIVAAALESPKTERVVAEVIDSRLLDDAVSRLLESEELWILVDEVARSPAVTDAITQQGMGFADQVAGVVRDRSRSADDRLEGVARRLLRRGPNGAP